MTEPMPALRMKAIESLLIEKGLISEAMIDRFVAEYEQNTGPLRGARVVAKAWTDPAFKERLLEDAGAAMRELGIDQFVSKHLVAVESTATVHNVVVCTLCSCYPWGVLGLPPSWYKSPEYRARIVREPRAVLAEFGLDLSSDVEIRVWDSSAEVRYLVLPMRPAGTDDLSEDELVEIVTRDSLIGTDVPKLP